MARKGEYDVIVVGGGPTGATAARELAEKGARVALVEKARVPRYKACGGGLTRRARALVPFNVSPVVERECRAAEIHLLDSDLHFKVTRQEPIVSLIMRDRFDSLLFEAASTAGALVSDDVAVVDVSSDRGRVTVHTEQAVLFARFVIGADGALSTVARKGGWGEGQRLIPLIEWEVAVPEETMGRFGESVRFDFGPVPGGYAWIFPKGSHLSAGIGSVNGRQVNLKKSLFQYLEALGITPTRPIEQHGHYVPAGTRRQGPVRGSILLAGDAAGLIDPVTGEGLSYAVMSGQAAARSIIDGGFDRARVREHYVASLRPIIEEIRWGRALSAVLYGSAAIRNRLFRKFGVRLADAMTDIFSGTRRYTDVFRSYLNYPRLLHRLLS